LLKEVYIELLGQYDVVQSKVDEFWEEIESKHSEKGRYYHNLTHLEDLYQQLIKVRSSVENWESVLFSLFYHDVIYNVSKANNEEKSAELAVARMKEIGANRTEIELTKKIILATKSHSIDQNSDVNTFTDADLSILGRDSDVYAKYCENIRKEYSMYPDFLYKKGRKRVVKHFLSMPLIYKTHHFQIEFEENARQNLNQEIVFSLR